MLKFFWIKIVAEAPFVKTLLRDRLKYGMTHKSVSSNIWCCSFESDVFMPGDRSKFVCDYCRGMVEFGPDVDVAVCPWLDALRPNLRIMTSISVQSHNSYECWRLPTSCCTEQFIFLELITYPLVKTLGWTNRINIACTTNLSDAAMDVFFFHS